MDNNFLSWVADFKRALVKNEVFLTLNMGIESTNELGDITFCKKGTDYRVCLSYTLLKSFYEKIAPGTFNREDSLTTAVIQVVQILGRHNKTFV